MFAICKILQRVGSRKHFRNCILTCQRHNSSDHRSNSAMSQFQFIQQVNPVSGQMEWKAQDQSKYDYFRDVARSSYADMLHDSERNQMYYKAIRIAVKKMHEQGRKAKVLDIGTGTGLLSMMAANVGADSVTAIEMFKPMADVAKLITEANGFGSIKVINKNSKDVVIGDGENLKEKANILVTELFDTELIGEGALEAYEHALANLMEENCIAVPHSATTYVQLVESAVMHSWHSLRPIKINEKGDSNGCIQPDPSMRDCPGVPAVHDIQLSQLRKDQFTQLTDAVEVFNFEWGSKSLSSEPRNCIVEAEIIASGKAQVALSWWTLSMDQDGEITLSTAPYWCHPEPTSMQWRDHWIQSVYFLPKEFDVTVCDKVQVLAYHDAYSMWFNAVRYDDDVANISTVRPMCEYLPRMLWSRPRMGLINDDQRNQAFVEVLRKVQHKLKTDILALCISDVSLLPLIVAKTCRSNCQVFSLETDAIGRRGIQNIVKHNHLSTMITILNSAEEKEIGNFFKNESINLLLGEPFFNASYLPWHNLRFWYARTELDDYLTPGALVVPCRAHLNIVAVQFDDLWKIRAPVGVVEGFDVSIMDDMITNAMEAEDYLEPEPHALWEYPCKLLSTPTSPITFNLAEKVPSEEVLSVGCVNIDKQCSGNSTCHAVVLWMVYDLDEQTSITEGLLAHNESTARWNMHHKQAVFFLRHPIFLKQNQSYKLEYEIRFIPKFGEVKMKFKVA